MTIEVCKVALRSALPHDGKLPARVEGNPCRERRVFPVDARVVTRYPPFVAWGIEFAIPRPWMPKPKGGGYNEDSGNEHRRRVVDLGRGSV